MGGGSKKGSIQFHIGLPTIHLPEASELFLTFLEINRELLDLISWNPQGYTVWYLNIGDSKGISKTIQEER